MGGWDTARCGGSGAGSRDNIARVDGLRKHCSSGSITVLPRLAATLVMVAMVAAPARAVGSVGAGSEAVPARPSSLLAIAAPPSTAGDTAPAAVVGLEADAPVQGAALTQALRRAFAARGLSGGEEVNLAELRLALGCKDSSPECLAKGGSLVRARRLIYGTLRRGGTLQRGGTLRRGEAGTWSLELTLVEAESGAATTETRRLTDADLAPDRIDATADAIADRLAPDTAVSPTPDATTGGLATPPPPPPEPVERSDEAPTRDGRVRWGWVKPQPRWKWIGFGVGAGLTVAGFVPAIGMSVWLSSRPGGFRGELIDAAEASLTDFQTDPSTGEPLTDENGNPQLNTINDVDPNLPGGVDLCAFARDRPTDSNGVPLGHPGTVRNASVVRVCNKGDAIRTGSVAATIVGGVGLATTVVFTILLFVHREPARRSSTWRRHGMMVGIDPVRGDGVSLRMGGRF
jgi:hypothetical protein